MSLEAQAIELAGTQNNGRYDHARSASTADNDEDMAIPSQSNPQYPLLPQTPSSGNSISIAIDPVALITTECITVTSAMRKHTRWAQSSVSVILGGGTSGSTRHESHSSLGADENTSLPSHLAQRTKFAGADFRGGDGTIASRWGLRGKKGRSMQDNPLMSAFARLRHDLRGCRGQHVPTMISMAILIAA
jgi:hypothetical protein